MEIQWNIYLGAALMNCLSWSCVLIRIIMIGRNKRYIDIAVEPHRT